MILLIIHTIFNYNIDVQLDFYFLCILSKHKLFTSSLSIDDVILHVWHIAGKTPQGYVVQQS